MANSPTAGELRHRVAFDKRGASTGPDYGNEEGPFAEQFQVHAAFRSRGGSEAVVAARLEGRNVLGVYVRSSTQTRQIESDWQMRDVRTGERYAVKIVDAVTDRRWVYLEVSTGVAA
ncbi:head-tail adaptor protein [Tianweitania sediminis]|uniref:Head-tail adaptor protein n=1 Tax=Tianweitania sediminis TaxID=1502156 RepID=A0A8J7UGQ2_9HYPH|nr:head-tail adaptor protein [Tianweitania sediminis]MBP0438424.1 head-tail adaptor protein [Tianweitania sediminis]